jgi:hypothetical protein
MSPMNTLRTSAAKTNDIFAKIAATTPGAVKTREALFGELKAELELHAKLEQDHLLPVMRKHAGTKAIADKVSERLRDMRTLMGRIEKAPLDGDDFPAKAAELKKLFQAHLRDEKNELLPAIQKALSDEEAAAVAEKIAAAKAAAAQAEQEAADKRRAHARRQREQAEARQAALDAAERAEKKAAAEAARAVKAAAEASQAQVDAVQGAMDAGLRAAAEVTTRAANRMAESVGEQTRSFGVAAQTGSAMAGGFQQASLAWMGWAQARVQNQTAGFAALMQCRTPQDVFAVQSRLMRQDVELSLETSRRVFGIAASAATDAASTGTR